MFWYRCIALEKGFRLICILSWLEIALPNNMLDNHTKLILEAHRLIVKFISPSGKGFFLYVLASLHSS